MKLWPRVLIASILGIATSCSLVYDVDSITSKDGACGDENDACCSGGKCNAALTCVDNVCQRCAKDGDKCCLAPEIAACSSDGGAINLNGTCDAGKCVLLCSASSPACSAIPNSLCCDPGTGCVTCVDSCVCKVCCAKCGSSNYTAIQINAGETCIDKAKAHCGELYVDSLWNPNGC